MEEFRNDLKRKLNLYALLCCLYPLFLIGSKVIFKNSGDFAQGLVLGICMSSMIVSIYFLVRNYTVLHNEEKLKKLYIELNDERNVSISKETMKTSSKICIVVTALACIVSGFINEIVCITLSADLLISAVITVAVQMYYKKKM